jgi:hypothetical protein
MRPSYTSGYGYNLSRTSVLTAKRQTPEELAASANALERVGASIAASVATARDRSEASQDGPPRDAAHRAKLEKVLSWRLQDVAAGWKCAQPDVDRLQARLALPNADAAPALPNAITADEQLAPELEDVPEGLDQYRLQDEISSYCRSVSEAEFRKHINECLAPLGYRLQRLPGWRQRQYGFGG